MSSEYEYKKETGLAPIGENENKDIQISKKESDSEEYYDLPLAIRSRTLLWAVISIVCGAVSILLSHYYYIGFVFAVAAVSFSVVSRKTLGFFEKYSIMGIIFGIMGFVTGTFALIVDVLNLF